MDALVPGVAVWDATGSQLTPVLGEWEGRPGGFRGAKSGERPLSCSE